MSGSRFPRSTVRLALGTTLALLAACSSDEIVAPPDDTEGTVTVDASTGWAYVSLADGATVAVADPAASSDWDIAFNATDVMLNGGAAGPAGVAGYCICQNAGASDDAVLAMTAEGELGDFETVDAAAVPAATDFETDALVPAVTGWYTGSGSGATAAPDEVWLVRLGDGTSFAKLHVVSLDAPTAEHPGTVTLEYAVQPSADAAFGPTETLEVDASALVQIDLNSGSASPTAPGWDLQFNGYTIRLNGGASGAGSAAAAESDQSFTEVTTASVDSRAYQEDGFAGVFNSHPWYRYNIAGDHRISPTFDVYLVQRGDAVYKLQLINYYSDTGDPRHITFRYAPLAD